MVWKTKFCTEEEEESLEPICTRTLVVDVVLFYSFTHLSEVDLHIHGDRVEAHGRLHLRRG